MYQSQLCKVMSLLSSFFMFNKKSIHIYIYILVTEYICMYVTVPAISSLWFSAIIVIVLVNMTSNNGLCLSLICQDRSVAMGFGSDMHGVSCGVVFAAEVAFLFCVGPVMVPLCFQHLLLKAFLLQQQRLSERHNPWAS